MLAKGLRSLALGREVGCCTQLSYAIATEAFTSGTFKETSTIDNPAACLGVQQGFDFEPHAPRSIMQQVVRGEAYAKQPL
eukprot:3264255-Amphidinium_carterae.1